VLVTDRNHAACVEKVSRADDLVKDLETDGLTPWKGSRMVGTAIEIEGEEPMYFGYRHGGGGNLSEGPAKLMHALRPRPGRTYRGWHLRFDFTTLAYEKEGGGDHFLSSDITMRDGIVDALLLNENEPSFSLEAISGKYLGQEYASTKTDMEKLLKERFPEIKKARERKGSLWRLSAAETETYACGDVRLPRLLAEKYAPAIEAWGLGTIATEMNAYALLLARMQKRGILIDRERCAELSRTTEARAAALLAELRVEADLPGFNPGSAPQVGRLLGTPNAQEATLKLCDHPLAQRIIDFKKLGRAKSTYYDAILGFLDADDILHPQLNLTRDPRDRGGTRSSRLSCSLPNFQALPHADDDPNAIYKVRDLVIPRAGRKIAKLDYERAEMWMGACYCKEPAIIRAYHERRDLYVEMVQALDISRHRAKILFLMLQYGAGAWKVAQLLGWPFKTVAMLEREFGKYSYEWGDEEWNVYRSQKAVQVKDGFFNLYPNIKSAMDAYGRHFESNGSLRLWTNRAIHFDPDTTPSYAAWNRIIQGAVGEMIRRAMQRLEPMIAQYDAYMILQVHDELVVEYPAEYEREVLKLCRYVMEDFDFDLKPRVDINTSAQNYAQMEAWKEAA
jgi:DNA polymerase-1